MLLLMIWFLSASAQEDFETIKNKADLAFMDGQYSDALKRYEQLIQSGEGDSTDMAMIYGYAAISEEQTGDKKQALQYYREALKRNVPQLMVYDQMIELAKAEKDHEAYEFALLQKQSEFPDFEASIIQSLAYHYFNTKQYDKLIEKSKILTGWYPDNATFHLFDAVARQNLDDVEGASASYKKVLAIDPDHAGANMGQGMILYKQASAVYDALKKNYESLEKPDRVDYSNYRKQLEKPKAIYNEALPYLIKAYKNPSYSSLKGVIRNCYLRTEDKETANKYL